MERAEWDRIQDLFHAAVERPEGERADFVARESGGDARLIAAVFGMLEEDQRSDSMLDGEVGVVAERMLDRPEIDGRQADWLGPYRIVDVLGEGGMGIVYLAERKDLGSRVAVKLLRDAWMSPERLQRFLREQRMLAQLTHPNIARLYDADTTEDGTPWFAMEYVPGIALTDYCEKKQASLRERLLLVRSVCEAVRYAHSLAVIHCDLKPGNILVDRDGVVKLLDFGIARQLGEEADGTTAGLLTAAYAAPEQLRGEQAGVYTDVYTFGLILNELLQGIAVRK